MLYQHPCIYLVRTFLVLTLSVKLTSCMPHICLHSFFPVTEYFNPIHVPIFLSLFLRLSFRLLSAFQFLTDFFYSFSYCHSFTDYLTLLFYFSLRLSYSLSLSLFLSISISLSLPHIFSVLLSRLALMALHVAKEVKEAEFSTIYKVLG